MFKKKGVSAPPPPRPSSPPDSDDSGDDFPPPPPARAASVPAAKPPAPPDRKAAIAALVASAAAASGYVSSEVEAASEDVSDAESEEAPPVPAVARAAVPAPKAAPPARPAPPPAVDSDDDSEADTPALPPARPVVAAKVTSLPLDSDTDSDAAPASVPAPTLQRSVSATSSRDGLGSGLGRSGKEESLEERIAAEWAFQAGMGDTASADTVHDPLPPPGYALDRYGFVVPSDPPPPPVSKEEAALELSRLTKWMEMGAAGDGLAAFAAKHPAKLKERVRKGVPNQLRGVVWQQLAGSRALRLRNAGLYEELLAGPSSAYEVDIIRDVGRTYPKHIHYCSRHGAGQSQLYRCLKAYAVFDPEVGYVQGMAYIAAIFLTYMGEEEAFWLLVALLKGATPGGHEPLEGMFTPGLPLVQLCLFQLDGLLSHVAPKLHAHLAAQGCEPSMYATQWFVTLFAYSLPFDVVLRIWDIVMLEGTKAVFRVAAALLLAQQDALCKLPFEELLPALRRAPAAGKASADALLAVAMDLKVSKKLEALTREFEAQQAAAAQTGGGDS